MKTRNWPSKNSDLGSRTRRGRSRSVGRPSVARGGSGDGWVGMRRKIFYQAKSAERWSALSKAATSRSKLHLGEAIISIMPTHAIMCPQYP